ncbi:CHM2A protein, partial [Rostratula benghalensis]|nr:CHM2A protein [Rostratula benghalensis]
MMEFEKQAEIMDMKEELMNDAIDDAMGDEDDEEERWGTHGGMGTGALRWRTWVGCMGEGWALPPPGGSLAAGEGRAAEAAAALADADADLEERLKNLRRD